jgi:hypothetical protein
VTVYVEYKLRCDGGAGPYDCEPAIYTLSAAEARQVAREKGWLVGRAGGKDYCPKHKPQREVKGCPSEAAYRRHLKAGEKCQECRDFMRRVETERRGRHSNTWGAGRAQADPEVDRAAVAVDPDQVDAIAYLTRTGNSDLLPALGLAGGAR